MSHHKIFVILSLLLFVSFTLYHGAEACSGSGDHWSEQDSMEDMVKADASFGDVLMIRKDLEEIKEQVDQIVIFLSHIYKGHEKKSKNE